MIEELINQINHLNFEDLNDLNTFLFIIKQYLENNTALIDTDEQLLNTIKNKLNYYLDDYIKAEQNFGHIYHPKLKEQGILNALPCRLFSKYPIETYYYKDKVYR